MVSVLRSSGLGGYCVDASEVTEGAYQAWLASNPSTAGQPVFCAWNTSYQPSLGTNGCGPGSYNPLSTPLLPVSCVDWCDARAYCASQNKRLCGHVGGGPSPMSDFADAASSEWYNACSGAGLRVYPYGDAYDPGACNGADRVVTQVPLPVKQLAACAGGTVGLWDMSGNVREWTDACDAFAGAGDSCRTRGGSYASDYQGLACADGSSATATATRDMHAATVGIRCCAE
jgi:formylglycine-generating enzyme required for sulfatase activity